MFLSYRDSYLVAEIYHRSAEAFLLDQSYYKYLLDANYFSNNQSAPSIMYSPFTKEILSLFFFQIY